MLYPKRECVIAGMCDSTETRLHKWGGKVIHLLIALLFTSTSARGDEVKHTLSIDIKQEYSDNLFFSTANIQRDFITTFSPGLEYVKNTERIKVSLGGRLDRRLYLDNNDLNATDQLYQGSVQYFFAPRSSLTGRANFSRDSRPDRDIATTGLVLNTEGRTQQRYSISGDYAFTEKTSAALSYEYAKETWNSPRFTDTESHSGNLLFLHDLNQYMPATLGRTNIRYARYLFADSIVENYQGLLGISKSFNEIWSILVEGGATYTRSRFEVAQLQFIPPFFITLTKKSEESEGWGAVSQATISSRGEKTNLNFAFNYNITPASGRVGLSKLTALSFGVNRRFTYELRGNISGGYIMNKSEQGEFSVQGIDTETLYINPSLRYDFTPDVAADASYTFTKTNDKVADTDASGNLFMFRFYLQHPIFE